MHTVGATIAATHSCLGRCGEGARLRRHSANAREISADYGVIRLLFYA